MARPRTTVRPVLCSGGDDPDAVAAPAVPERDGGQLRIAMRLTFAGDRIAEFEAIADPEALAHISVETTEPAGG